MQLHRWLFNLLSDALPEPVDRRTYVLCKVGMYIELPNVPFHSILAFSFLIKTRVTWPTRKHGGMHVRFPARENCRCTFIDSGILRHRFNSKHNNIFIQIYLLSQYSRLIVILFIYAAGSIDKRSFLHAYILKNNIHWHCNF